MYSADVSDEDRRLLNVARRAASEFCRMIRECPGVGRDADRIAMLMQDRYGSALSQYDEAAHAALEKELVTEPRTDQ